MEPAAHHQRLVAAAACAVLALSTTGTILTGGIRPGYGAEAGDRAAWQTIAVSPVTEGPGEIGPRGIGPARARSSGVRATAVVPPRRTRPFSLLGVTWADPDARLRGTVEVRTRHAADGRWIGWRRLVADEPDAADAASDRDRARGSTDPLWVDGSDGVEARIVADAGSAAPALPAGLRIDLIDPDAATSPAGDAAAPQADESAAPQAADTARSAHAAGSSAPRAERGLLADAPVPMRPVPPMVSRRAWGADDSIVERASGYTSDVQALFVHHTATGNDYTCGQSARIIRGIQAYHVRSKGWNDIGYNFLVDRCGTLYEGRGGGITRPVLGAHTRGFNAHSAGIAVIGDYDARGVSAVVRQAIARVAAYKIGMYGRNPATRVTLVSAGSNKYRRGTPVRLDRISGHRDVVLTDCPGNHLYAQLGSIRRLAGGSVVGLTVNRLAGSIQLGSTFYTRGLVTAAWTTRTSSTLINRFDVLVDGRRAVSVPGGHRAVLLRLLPGRHTLQPRAVHLSGRVAVGRVYSLFVDRIAPTFVEQPVVSLGRGSLRRTVPVALGWRVSDPGGLRSVMLTRPVPMSLGAATTRWATAALPGVETTWALRATDRSGNDTQATTTGTPVLLSEAAAVRSGAWSVAQDPAYLDGAALRSSTIGAALTWSFTGSGASLVFSEAARSGRVVVAVDGREVAVVDLRTASPGHRRVAWARNWAASGTHTVTATVEGTAGRPEVVSDGLVYLR